MKIYYDKKNDQLYCTDAYNCKDALKALGFQWNYISKEWFLKMPKGDEALGNLMCDIFVDCSLAYDELNVAIFNLPADRRECMMAMDEAHLTKFEPAIRAAAAAANIYSK